MLARSRLKWCLVCGQVVVGESTSVRVNSEAFVHAECFRCSSCNCRLSVQTFRQDHTHRLYCAKHHDGYTEVGSAFSLPRSVANAAATRVRADAIPARLSPSSSDDIGDVVAPHNLWPKAPGSSIALSRNSSLSSSLDEGLPEIGSRSPVRKNSRRSSEPLIPSRLSGRTEKPMEKDEDRSDAERSETPPRTAAPRFLRQRRGESPLEESFLKELRQFKDNCQRAARQLESTDEVRVNSTMLPPGTVGETSHSQSPASVRSLRGSTSSDSPAQRTVRQLTNADFRSLPHAQVTRQCNGDDRQRSAVLVRSAFGYVTETVGQSPSPPLLARIGRASSAPGATGRREDGDGTSKDGGGSRHSQSYEVESLLHDAYGNHFVGSDHWNYFNENEPGVGPIVLSLRQETSGGQDSFRLLVRSPHCMAHGLLSASCLLANRYIRDQVVEAVGKEMNLEKPLRLSTYPKAAEEIVKLDQAFNSRQMKVGVLYVKAGQTTEEEIFSNSKGSEHFNNFLDLIGKRVLLKDFTGYRGGLDVDNGQTGEESLYLAWEGHDVMFHVSTLLPHNETDKQQLQKKRHIGNDMLCVVFIDDASTPFNPACIRSHFLQTFLVIHRSNNSYTVATTTREAVPRFGPSLSKRNTFPIGTEDDRAEFRSFFLAKLVNGYRASMRAPKFLMMKTRTTSQMLNELTTTFKSWENHRQDEPDTFKKKSLIRRGSWLPLGAVRPASPLLDSKRERFTKPSRLSEDLHEARQAHKVLCDVNFIVGDRRVALPAIKAVLVVRSRALRDFFNIGQSGGSEDSCSLDGSLGSAPSPSTSADNEAFFTDGRNSFLRRSAGSRKRLAKSVRRPSKSVPKTEKQKAWKTKTSSNDGVSTGSDEQECTVATSPVKLDDGVGDGEVETTPQLSSLLRRLAPGIDVFQVDDFSVEAFSAVLEYIHSGKCTTSASTVAGITCAASLFELRELETVCVNCAGKLLEDMPSFISVMRGLEPYIGQHPVARRLFETSIAPYVEAHASEVLSCPGLATLGEGSLQLIYQCKLGSDESKKFQAASLWAEVEAGRRHNGESSPEEVSVTVRSLLAPLVKDLVLHRMPPADLIKLVQPSGSIPNERIMMALAFQVDPNSVEGLDGAPAHEPLCRKGNIMTESSAPSETLNATAPAAISVSHRPIVRETRVRVTDL